MVDREGNILSIIQSNYAAFGSDVTVQGMGFVLHNRGGLFSLDPKSPNALAGHKRPFHTIIPAFMQNGDQHIGFGIMGGMNQPLAHAQFVSNVVDYGMNIQAALEEARFTVSPKLGCNIVIESRVPAESRRSSRHGSRAGCAQGVLYRDGPRTGRAPRQHHAHQLRGVGAARGRRCCAGNAEIAGAVITTEVKGSGGSRMVFPFGVALQLVAVEVDFAQVAGAVSLHFILEVWRCWMAALSARRHRPGAHLIPKLHHRNKAVAAGSVPLLRPGLAACFLRGVGPRAE